MTTIIVVFASSLFLTIAMLVLKVFELKCGREDCALYQLRKLEPIVEKLIKNLKFKYIQTHQTVRFIFTVQIKTYCKNLFHEITTKILTELHKRQNALMGQKQIATSGSASFYLKKIAESKVLSEKGKIEDESIENLGQ